MNTTLFVFGSVFGGVLFYLFCVLFGTFLFKIIQKKASHDILEQFVLSSGLGVGAVAMLLLLLGFLQLYSLSFLLGTFLFLLLLCFRQFSTMKNYAFGIKSLVCSAFSRKGLPCFCVFVLLLMMALFFLIATSPETEWDALSFHLATAKVYVREQGIVPIYYAYHAALPHLFDMLYVAGELWKSDVFSRAFVLCINLTIMIGIWIFGKKFFSEDAGIFGAVTFLTTPVLMVYMPATYIDIPLGIFALGAVWSFLCWKQDRCENWLVLTALFLGFAISSKIILAPLAVALVLAYWWYAIFENKLSHMIFWTFLFGFVVVLFLVPWFVFNYATLDNPVYPFLHGTFSGKYWSNDLAIWWSNARATYSTGKTVWNYFLIPVTLSFFPNTSGPIYGFSALYIMLVPLLLLFFDRKERETLCFLSVLLFICLTCWFLVAPDMRYLFYLVPFFAVLSGYVLTRILGDASFGSFCKRISCLLFVLVLLSNLFLFFVIFRSDVSLFAGNISRDTYIAQDSPIYYTSQWINANLATDAVVFLANDDKGYYIDRTYIIGYGVYSTYIDYIHLADADALAARLHELGVTHVLIHTYENGRLVNYPEYDTLHTTTLLSDLQTFHLTFLYSENDVAVYSLQ